MRLWIFSALLALFPAIGHALMAEVEMYEVNATAAGAAATPANGAAVYASTNAVLYFEQCQKKKFEAYQWKTWQGYYSIRAYLQPMALIVVRRDDKDPIIDDLTDFIEKAKEETQKAGGTVFCLIKYKASKKNLGLESVTFQAYRQLVQASYAELATYYANLNGGLPVRVQDLPPPQ